MPIEPTTSDDDAATVSGGILRKHLTERFTQLPNETLRNPTLSFKAVGVLAHILSLPDGSTVSATSLATAHTDGRSSVLTALQELAATGYYRCERLRDDLGRFRMVVAVSDLPMHESPECDFPTPDNPTPENLTPRDKYQEQTPRETPLPHPDTSGATNRLGFPTAAAIRTGTPYPDAFLAFWSAYPRKIGKTDAYKAWLARLAEAKKARIPLERRTEMMVRAAVNYASYTIGRDLEHVKHPSTFLGPSEHWKDFATSAAPEASTRRNRGEAQGKEWWE